MIQTKAELKLIHTIKKQIKPDFPHWVLFREGSYVIFTDEQPHTTEELRIWALEEMQRALELLSTVYTYKEDIIPVSDPKGWVVPAMLRGIYTFVGLDEFQQLDPSDIAIWVKGRNKQILDSQKLEIIYINCPSTNACCSAKSCSS
jgi:hypothetical protein